MTIRRILARCAVCQRNIPGPGEGTVCRWCREARRIYLNWSK